LTRALAIEKYTSDGLIEEFFIDQYSNDGIKINKLEEKFIYQLRDNTKNRSLKKSFLNLSTEIDLEIVKEISMYYVITSDIYFISKHIAYLPFVDMIIVTNETQKDLLKSKQKFKNNKYYLLNLNSYTDTDKKAIEEKIENFISILKNNKINDWNIKIALNKNLDLSLINEKYEPYLFNLFDNLLYASFVFWL
jgi:hypothetical protein